MSTLSFRIARAAGLVIVSMLLAGPAVADEAQPVSPLLAAHAHNDYEHKRPLLDALDQGFCSVEADIFLVEDKLLVAHDRDKVKPDRTLEALYLDPLAARVKSQNGRVYVGGPQFSLLIDLKTDWKTTYPVLRQTLSKYTEMLTTFREGKSREGAVLVVISGNRAKEMFTNEEIRYAAYDGLVSDLDGNDPWTLVPWISANWRSLFEWRAEGEFPPEEREKLRLIVTKAHQQGRRLRFWGAPDVPRFWQEMLEQRVDLINTDRLAALSSFLAGKMK